MTTQFITNQQRLLSDVVNNILPSSQKLYALVGYFYFSGFQELYQNLAEKEIRILVGMEVEKDITNKIREFEVLQDINAPRGKIRDNYFKSLVSLFNDTDFFDTKEKQDAFRLFLNKMKDGTLQIRKTIQPNHAKLYIFENKTEASQGGEFPGTVITGSSNLSHQGLRGRFEINVITREAANYKEAMSIFDQLWQTAVTIVDKDNLDDFLKEVVQKVWLELLPDPFLLYVRVLEEYFTLRNSDNLRLPDEITLGRYINLKYQIDAIRKTLDIIQAHNGVIIADVVGLGKSVIASAVANNLNLKTIVIAPPHLKKQWEDYRFDFRFNARVYSSGMIQQAVDDNSYDEEKLIIVDEAHKYRNELTEDYANLHQLCQRNKVMLLSATPFNNQPQDIFSMIKLFQIPTRSTIQTVDNLSYQFKKLVAEYKLIGKIQKDGSESAVAIDARIQKVASEIRDILSPLVIRRSRLDLEAIDEYKADLKRQKISFPTVNDPQEMDYDLGDISELYENTLKTIAPEEQKKGFIGARYMPTNYIKNYASYKKKIAEEMGIDENLLKQGQANLAKFMKRLLVRRFESSIFAFQSTLDSLIKSTELVQDWYEKAGLVPIYKKGQLPDVDSLLEGSGEDIDEELQKINFDDSIEALKEKGVWFIEKKELGINFIKHVEKDLEILKEIRDEWFADGPRHDPKLEEFERVMAAKLKENPKRKIVVFTEFADTADYLFDKLKDRLRLFKYSGKDSTKANKETIRTNFDAGSQTQADDYDVLIATDAISEGYNLHRAGIVFNYDIPYNPTRVIQRVGRINRINKKVFDELFIYNFFPTKTGERETRVKGISTLKIAMIHALMGEDTKVLTSDEQLQSFFAEEFRKQMTAQEELSPEVRHENFIRNLRSTHPEIIEKAVALPKRCRVRRSHKKDLSGVIVFARKGGEYVFKTSSQLGECQSINISEALNLFEAEISEKPKKVTDDFEPMYAALKENLFSKRSEVAMNKAKQDTIHKVRVLIKELPEKKDYLQDLLYVLQQLDALPGRYSKIIRAIDSRKLLSDFEKFYSQVPHRYIVSIIERENKIEEGEESLILSEELI
ncbi:MAG: helicase [Planctomycetes bacterium]|nr:helicase [Planctomycetota bacterium]